MIEHHHKKSFFDLSEIKGNLMYISKTDILERVTNHYLSSGDFNGSSVINLLRDKNTEWHALKRVILGLLTLGLTPS
jgi:hypothetical protein